MHRSFLLATASRCGQRSRIVRDCLGSGGLNFQGSSENTTRLYGKATDTVRIKIPEGVIAVKPMPKAGWKIEKVVARYAAEYELHGKKVNEGITHLAWSSGKLADDEYDEFVLRRT